MTPSVATRRDAHATITREASSAEDEPQSCGGVGYGHRSLFSNGLRTAEHAEAPSVHRFADDPRERLGPVAGSEGAFGLTRRVYQTPRVSPARRRRSSFERRSARPEPSRSGPFVTFPVRLRTDAGRDQVVEARQIPTTWAHARGPDPCLHRVRVETPIGSSEPRWDYQRKRSGTGTHQMRLVARNACSGADSRISPYRSMPFLVRRDCWHVCGTTGERCDPTSSSADSVPAWTPSAMLPLKVETRVR